MRKTNKTYGVIRSSYKSDEHWWWVIMQIVGALVVMAIILKLIIDN